MTARVAWVDGREGSWPMVAARSRTSQVPNSLVHGPSASLPTGAAGLKAGYTSAVRVAVVCGVSAAWGRAGRWCAPDEGSSSSGVVSGLLGSVRSLRRGLYVGLVFGCGRIPHAFAPRSPKGPEARFAPGPPGKARAGTGVDLGTSSSGVMSGFSGVRVPVATRVQCAFGA